MRDWLEEVMHAGRAFRRSPALSCTVVLTLALGVGLTVGVFEIAYTVLLRALPFHEPEQLVAVWNESAAGERLPASWPELAEWRSQSQAFASVAGYYRNADGDLASTGGADAQAWQVSEMQVSDGFFATLGVRPFLGREFEPAELQPWPDSGPTPGEISPTILSYETWQSRFGGRPDVLGCTLVVGRWRRVVVGVMPDGFGIQRDGRHEMWAPMGGFVAHRLDRDRRSLQVVARLQPNAGLAQARAALAAASRQSAPHAGAVRPQAAALHEALLGSRRPHVTALLGAAAIVLLLACANVSALLLVRGSERRRELAVRAALGASRLRLARRGLVECGVLGAVGGVLGLLLGGSSARLLGWILSTPGIPLPTGGMDLRVVVFTLFVSLGTSLLCGLAPLTSAWRLDPIAGLQGGAGRAVRGGVPRLHRVLVGGQVALSFVLLVAMALLLASLVQLRRAPAGFAREGVLTASVGSVPLDSFDDSSWRRRYSDFWPRLIERVSALPGVRAAAVGADFPLSARDSQPEVKLRIAGADATATVRADQGWGVTPGYFEALGVPLLRGRLFETRDLPSTRPESDRPVAILSHSLGRALFAEADPIGREIMVRGRAVAVVGVVADVRQHDLRSGPARQLYTPLWFGNFEKYPAHYLIVRTAAPAGAVLPMIRDAVRGIDPERTLGEVRTMEDVVSGSLAWERLEAQVVVGFAALAVLLSALGIYGSVARDVSSRTAEIGLRLALGARRHDLFRLIAGSGLRHVWLAIPPGALLAWLVGRTLSNRLFGIEPSDPRVYVGIALLLAFLATAACLLPTRRALRIHPAVSLRGE